MATYSIAPSWPTRRCGSPPAMRPTRTTPSFITGDRDGSLRIEGDHSDAVAERRQFRRPFRQRDRRASGCRRCPHQSPLRSSMISTFRPSALAAADLYTTAPRATTSSLDPFVRSHRRNPRGPHRKQGLLVGEPEVLNVVLVGVDVGEGCVRRARPGPRQIKGPPLSGVQVPHAERLLVGTDARRPPRRGAHSARMPPTRSECLAQETLEPFRLTAVQGRDHETSSESSSRQTLARRVENQVGKERSARPASVSPHWSVFGSGKSLARPGGQVAANHRPSGLKASPFRLRGGAVRRRLGRPCATAKRTRVRQFPSSMAANQSPVG